MSDTFRQKNGRRLGLTAEQRAERSRKAAVASWDKTVDRSARTAPARKVAMARFGSDEERRAHFADMARKRWEKQREAEA